MAAIDFSTVSLLFPLEPEGIYKCQGKCLDEEVVFVEISSLLNNLPELILFPEPDSLCKGHVLYFLVLCRYFRDTLRFVFCFLNIEGIVAL